MQSLSDIAFMMDEERDEEIGNQNNGSNENDEMTASPKVEDKLVGVIAQTHPRHEEDNLRALLCSCLLLLTP